MEKTINLIKFLAIINPVIVIFSLYLADLSYPRLKGLVAVIVTIICVLQYSLLDKTKKTLIKKCCYRTKE